jgi:3',5'-cyclic AMP phosphodiesterase CpdA
VPVVAHLSDVHFGAHVEDLAESLLADVVEQRPDLVVVSGDLTQRARRAQFAAARIFLERFSAPVLTVVGNHDIPLFDLGRRLFAPTARYERYINDDLDPVVALPGLVALGTNTMPPWRWKAAHVSYRQAELVRRAFADAPAEAWRLLVTHHPVVPASATDVIGRQRIIEAAADSGVTVLLAGHTHVPTVDLVTLGTAAGSRRAVAVVTGTAISHRTRGITNAYAVLELAEQVVTGAQLTVRIRQPVDDRWTTVRAERFEYGQGGLASASS